MKMIAVVGSKTYTGAEAKAVVLEASKVRAALQEARRPIRRLVHSPERLSIAKAMDRVERRLVDAYWVLGRSTASPGPRRHSQHGVGYMLEREDKWGAAVAGGGWLTDRPAPPPASSQEITSSDEALEWLQFLDKQTASVVAAGARSKLGDQERRVNWLRVRAQLPECSAWSRSMLHRTYREGLRIIAVQVGV